MASAVERATGEAGQRLHLAFEIPGAGDIGAATVSAARWRAMRSRRIVLLGLAIGLGRGLGDDRGKGRIGATFHEAGEERPFAHRDAREEWAVAEQRRQQFAAGLGFAPSAGRAGGDAGLGQRLLPCGLAEREQPRVARQRQLAAVPTSIRGAER